MACTFYMEALRKEYRYFPGLNGLRCIGAGFVFVSHLEQIKEDFGLTPHYWNFTQNKFGTIVFLVLSGFLISHLLFTEKQKLGTIRISNFYLKRVLRIWPVYYIIVLSSLFILNRTDLFEIPVKSAQVYENFRTNLFFYSFMLPNLVMIPYAAHTWTIGLIEQFYLVYPVLVRYVNKISLLPLLLVSIVLSPDLLAAIPFSIYLSQYPRLLTVIHLIADFSLTFSCIATGCIAYLLYFYKTSILPLLYKRVTQILCVLLLIFLLFFSPDFHFVTDNRIYAVLISIILLNVATQAKPLFSLENKVFRLVGNISYGIYMYHPITIVIALQLIRTFIPTNFHYWSLNVLLYVSSIALTILVAAVSYEYIEKPFLRLKTRFFKINSDEISSTPVEILQPTPKKNSVFTG